MADKEEKSSWLEPLPGEYAGEDDMTGKRMIIAALTVVILAIFGGLIWYSYLEDQTDGPVPIIRADKAVVKEKPDTPGGLEVPDQDKAVFDRITDDPQTPEETLAPSAEMPLPLPDAPEKTLKETVEATGAESPVVVPEKTVVKETAVKETTVVEKAKPATTGDYLVQLGAFSKKETAESLWVTLQKKHEAILGGLDSDIVMIDRGKKGPLYRLRAGMLADRAAADKICAALKAKRQPCLAVVK